MKWYKALLPLLFILAILLVPVQVQGSAPYYYPDVAGPTVQHVDAFKNYVTTGDLFVVVRSYIKYTAPYQPDVPANLLYSIRMMNSDLTTIYGTTYVSGYYNDTGYEHNISAMYWDAATAPTWGGSYKIVMSGNPIVAWKTTGNVTANPPSHVYDSISWRSTSTVEATSNLLYTNFKAWANVQAGYWGTSLTQETADGTKFSSVGETYFTGVVPGIRTQIPQLFTSGASVPINTEPEDYQHPYQDSATAWWPFGNNFVSQWLGLGPDDVVRTILTVIALFFLASYLGAAFQGRFDMGFLIAAILSFPLSRMGFITFIWIIIFGAICIFAFVVEYILQRGAT